MLGFHAAAANFGGAQWWAIACLGILGGAAAFYLWVFALEVCSFSQASAVP
jgi:drug/metabolite transporter (DMT)-like permease